MSDYKCMRCQQLKPRVYFIAKDRDRSFAAASDEPRPLPKHENSCEECLTDAELARFLAPVAYFVLDAMLNAGGKVEALAPARAYLQFLLSPEVSGRSREKALEALKGTVRIQPVPDTSQEAEAFLEGLTQVNKQLTHDIIVHVVNVLVKYGYILQPKLEWEEFIRLVIPIYGLRPNTQN